MIHKSFFCMIRMNMRRFYSLLLLLLLLSSCNRGYRVEGNSSVTSFDGKMLFLKTLHGGEWMTIDSAEVVHGLFSMRGPADSVRMVTLYMNEEALMPLILEDGKVEVTISHSQLTAQGTPLNDKLYEFIEKRNAMEVRIEELERKEARLVLDGANVDDVHAQLEKEAEAMIGEMNDYVKHFIVENYDNVLGPSVFMMMCSTLPYPVMTSQIEDIMRTAPLSFKNNLLVKDFLDKAKENMQLIEEHKRMQSNVQVATQNRP